MSPEIFRDMLVGVTAGWAVLVFQKPYEKFIDDIIKHVKPKDEVIFALVNGLLWAIGGILLIIILILIAIFS